MENARAEHLGALPVDEEAVSVERARARDAVVWSRWFDDYYGLLFRYAAVRTGDRNEAADIASQVFLEAMRGIDRYSYRGRPVLAWLYGIAANLVAARLRGRRRALPQHSAVESGVDPTDGQIESLMLRDALMRLTEDQREVITLTYVLDLPAREAATILGKKAATVYSLQARALTNLRRMLAETS